MIRALALTVPLLALCGCGSTYQAFRDCNAAIPMPLSYRVGSNFGLFGVIGAYADDGTAISNVNAARGKCMDEKLARKE